MKPKGSLSDIGIFSLRHITAFMHLGTLNSPSALYLGAISNSEITNKKHRKRVTRQTLRRTLAYSTGLTLEGRASLSSPSARKVHITGLTLEPLRAHPHMATKASLVLIFRLQMNFSK